MSAETEQVVPNNGNGAGGDTLHRQPSYLSLSSGKSVYLTANENSSDDEFETCDSSFQGTYSSSGEVSEASSTAGEATDSSSLRGPEDEVDSGVEHLLTPASVQRLQNSLSKKSAAAAKITPADIETSSSTLEEEEISKQSIMSSNGDDDEEWEEDGDREGDEDEDGESEEMIEVQEDVLKLCNDIAEAQQPDFQKQAEIERACFENVRELRSLAISEAGLLSSKSQYFGLFCLKLSNGSIEI